jgi:ABC-type nitrate/sulfonate/bicarbonate transport system substrate-binding protein
MPLRAGGCVMSKTLRGVYFAIALAMFGSSVPALGQDLIKVKISRLAFPSLSTMMIDIVKARGIDKKHGIDLEGVTFSAISGYYGALANGEADMTASGPLVVQKMILEGVPIRIGLTWARMNIMSVITGDPSIKSIEDLKGKTIAADMGSAEYQTLAVYGRTQNIVFGKDISVVQAGPPLARSQLLAKRVEASMLWEPTTTLALQDNPDYRVILAGDKAWSAISKTVGWDLVLAMREDFLRDKPQAISRLLAMFQEAQQWYAANLDEADKILNESTKLPIGVFKAAVASGRLAFDIKPAWESEREAIWNLFKVAVDAGYLPKLPSENVIYKP